MTERRDRLIWLVPLALVGILAAAFTGVTLAKSTAPQANPTPVATSPPSPTVTTTPEPKTIPTNDAAKAQTVPTGWMKLKESPAGCTPAFDSPDESKEQTVCFRAGQVFQVVGEERNGFTALKDGQNKFWIETQFLEPAQQPSPAPSALLPALPNRIKEK